MTFFLLFFLSRSLLNFDEVFRNLEIQINKEFWSFLLWKAAFSTL